MNAFRFRLQAVLEWKQSQLDKALAQQNILRAERAAAEEAIRRNGEEMALQVQARMSGLELANYQQYLERLQREKVWLQKRLDSLEGQLRQQMTLVIKASRDVKTLERLKEHRRAEWLDAINRELESLVSDVVANRWTTGGHGANDL